jgi:transcriptional regulator with XRE-family HTH domain
MKYRAFTALLLRQMQQWESAQGKRATLQGFADHLEVSQPLLSIWLKGETRPSSEKLELLANKLGSEVYEVLGLPRPDPDLTRLNQIWPRIPETMRRSIVKQAEQFLSGTKNEKQRRPRRPT